jgi:hypothetical protein
LSLGFDSLLDEFYEDAIVAEIALPGHGFDLSGDLAGARFHFGAHQYTVLVHHDPVPVSRKAEAPAREDLCSRSGNVTARTLRFLLTGYTVRRIHV